ncbi:MAG: hypothetical protein IT444_14055 [Phycisphaeraceae bacterium]|nr:hypothetical protein [Phycisphaeraceae bacterium]
MQRTQDGGVIISCDFCATDWDPQTGLPPMTEGHHGSVLCLECLKAALGEVRSVESPYRCTLCLRENLPTTLPAYRNPLRPAATACRDCVHQAAQAFSRDPDVDWKWKR